jgi:hypothetical protein
MASGQGDKAKAGFQLWLDGGGRELLSRMAKMRARRKRWLKEEALAEGASAGRCLRLFATHIVRVRIKGFGQ